MRHVLGSSETAAALMRIRFCHSHCNHPASIEAQTQRGSAVIGG
jgi:hypothetical protein